MTNKKEINAGIIVIGNEILSGRTQDTNTSTISEWLNTIGIKVMESRAIPDIEKYIIDTVNELRNKYNYVFTTGGIGPTHDDITAKSISRAMGLIYGPHKEAMSILEKYYKSGEFNEGRQKMAWMPTKANLILNPTSGAPGFNVENVFCLPGVPSILKAMLGGINNKLIGGDPILSLSIKLRTVESEIAQSLQIIQDSNQKVDIGSYPFFKAGKLGVSLVLRSVNQSDINNCAIQIKDMIKEKKIEILEEI